MAAMTPGTGTANIEGNGGGVTPPPQPHRGEPAPEANTVPLASGARVSGGSSGTLASASPSNQQHLPWQPVEELGTMFGDVVQARLDAMAGLAGWLSATVSGVGHLASGTSGVPLRTSTLMPASSSSVTDLTSSATSAARDQAACIPEAAMGLSTVSRAADGVVSYVGTDNSVGGLATSSGLSSGKTLRSDASVEVPGPTTAGGTAGSGLKNPAARLSPVAQQQQQQPVVGLGKGVAKADERAPQAVLPDLTPLATSKEEEVRPDCGESVCMRRALECARA